MQQQRLVLNLTQLTGNLNGWRSQNEDVSISPMGYLLHGYDYCLSHREFQRGQPNDVLYSMDIWNWNPRCDYWSI